MTRVATFSHQRGLANNSLRTQTELANRQLQVSTGLKSTTFDGIARDSKRYLDLQTDIQRLEIQNRNNEIVVGRMNEMASSLTTLIQTLDQALTTLASALATNNEIQAQTQIKLDASTALLNKRVEGRYIFSGTATNTQPIDTTAVGWGPFAPPSAPNFNYYQGDATQLTYEAADTFFVPYGVTADDPAIEQALRGMQIVLDNPGNQVARDEGYALIDAARIALNDINQRVYNQRTAVANRIDENDSIITRLENTAGDLAGVDVAQASVELSNYEAQLEASFATITRLTRLSLVNYLN